ncbi:MAG: glycoside hydrolase family 57 protein [Myxococcaceae bacterium]
MLHAHLPYVRHAGAPPPLEADWLPEAVAGTYLPLLEVLERLAEDGIPVRLTLSVSPTLASMLDDRALRAQVGTRLAEHQALAAREVRRTAKDASLGPLARYHLRRLRQLRGRWERCRGRLLPAFVGAERQGQLALITSAATHAFLPHLRHWPGALQAQVQVAVQEHVRLLGRRPCGFWLPECGYFPGVEGWLAQQGLRFTFLEARGVALAEPQPVASVYAPLFTPSGVAAYGRDPESSEAVWSAESGYPADAAYLDFHRDAGWELPLSALEPVLRPGEPRRAVGLRYHRVTGRTEEKALYQPEAARRRAQGHARHFVACRVERLAALRGRLARPAVLVAPYDAELFGHWWHEGPVFLEALFREAHRQGLALSTPVEDLQRFPVAQLAAPAESSWGSGGSAATWLHPNNDWIVPEVSRATAALCAAAAAAGRRTEAARRLLHQAARELLLSQSSDFPFILRAGTVVDYATARVRTHLQRFWALLDGAQGRPVDAPLAQAAFAEDVLFPKLSFRVFAPP